MTTLRTMQKTTYSCSHCGGSHVQVAKTESAAAPPLPTAQDVAQVLKEYLWPDDRDPAEAIVAVNECADDLVGLFREHGGAAPDEHKVFVAVDDEFICDGCIPEELRARLGDSDVEVWEYFSTGWLAPCVCRSCKLSIPVYTDGS